MRLEEPEGYNKTSGRLTEGALLKEGKGGERKEKDIEVRKTIKQKEDRHEERREDIKRKGIKQGANKNIANAGPGKEDISQGECLDSTWTCEKCKTKSAESYKFCMECAERNPK